MFTDPPGVWGRDLTATPITDLEMHLCHCLGATSLILAINHIVAIFMENSHYRGMTLFLQTLFGVVDVYSYQHLGKDVLGIIYVSVALGIGGLIIHSMEPGIFTKDHGKAKTG